jgi:hypothetical protein
LDAAGTRLWLAQESVCEAGKASRRATDQFNTLAVPEKLSKEAAENAGTRIKRALGTKLLSIQPNSVQRETYIRGNNKKKKIKEADFPSR